MPELAFAYSCGKEIMADRENVFGKLAPKWKREENLGNGGSTDLLFELANGKCIAIEFKLRDRGDAYIRDIEKLLRLNSDKYVIAFCALIDTSSDKVPDDGRVSKVEAFSSVKVLSLLEPKPHFVTKQARYKSETSCVVGFWSIGLE
jgi:hypothetical protein